MRKRLQLTAEEIEEAIMESEFVDWFEEFGIPDRDIENEIDFILERLGFEEKDAG